MNRFTISLSLPDVNVWMALILEHHVHRPQAWRGGKRAADQSPSPRFTQIGVLRLLTTRAAMDGKPLTMVEAWRVHDRIYADDRVVLLAKIVFSLLQRKTLNGGSFKTKDQLREAIEAFIRGHNERAKPFRWRKREVKGSQLRNTIVNLCN